MKKFLILLLIIGISISMLFVGISCKEAAETAVPAEEATEEAAEANAQVEEATEEEVVAEEEETYIFPGGVWSMPFWQLAASGAIIAGEELGVNIEIMGPTDFIADEVLAGIDLAIAKNPTGIITYPWEIGEAGPLTEYYNNGGLIGVWFEKTSSFPYHIINTPDASSIAVDLLNKAIEIRGDDNFKLALGMLVGAGYHESIFQTIKDEIANNHPNITLVEPAYDQGMSAEESAVNASAFVSANPDVDVYIVTATLVGSPTARALSEAGYAPGEKTLLFGYYAEEVLADFESGYLQAAYALNPQMETYWLVQMLHHLAMGQGKITESADEKYDYIPLPLAMISRSYWIESVENAKDYIQATREF